MIFLIDIYTAGEMSGDVFPTHVHDMVFSENWRMQIEYLFDKQDFISIRWLHPGRINADKHGTLCPSRTVIEDINLIIESDVCIAFLNREGLDGTIVELVHAATKDKHIFVIISDELPTQQQLDNGNYVGGHSIGKDFADSSTMGVDFDRRYWFLLHYLQNKLGRGFGFVISNMTWIPGGIIKEKVAIQTAFKKFLIKNEFIINDYNSYINSDSWKKTSLDFRTFNKGVCALCMRNVGINNLQTHHKKYPKNFKDDREENWIAICKTCHEKIHGTDKSKQVFSF